MSNCANFSGASNAGLQVGQNHGTVESTVTVHNYTQPLPTRGFIGAQEECHRLFRLVNNSQGDGYEWYKNRIEDRVEGTCEWFLQHENYRLWKESSSGPLLVSADPGCGKSVLAKHLIEHELSGAVCYFFFKDQDQNTVKQALCALLHQLFIREPSVIEYAMVEYSRNGQNLINLSDVLWNIFWQAALDPRVGPAVFVLDALDECTESDLQDLVRQLTRHFSNTKLKCKVKFLMTSRPYQDIVSSFWQLIDTFPEIRIPGEEHSEEIAMEVNCVIGHRMDKICRRFKLKENLRRYLKNSLLEVKHRTYLWVYLVFEHLEHGFKRTEQGIKDCIKTLPESVSEAYEKILTRSKSKETVRKVLLIILGASRPLTLEEMNVAVNIFDGCKSEQSLDLEATGDFKESLRDLCGLFISINDSKVYFLHQTAREFLLQTSLTQESTESRSWYWYGSMTLLQCHSHLAEICINYLRFDVWKQEDLLADHLPCGAECIGYKSSYVAKRTHYAEQIPQEKLHALGAHLGLQHKFFEYSALNWTYHYRSAELRCKQRLHSQALQACMMIGELPPAWFLFDWITNEHYSKQPMGLFHLLIASYHGLDGQVEQLLRTQHPNYTDKGGETALHYVQHVSTAQLLLQHGACVHSKCHKGRSPLWMAVSSDNLGIVQLFIDNKALVNEYDLYGAAPMHKACQHGNEHATKALLAAGANINMKGPGGETPLSYAVASSVEGCVRMLLDAGASVNERNDSGETPLTKTLFNDYNIVKLLLDHGAEVDLKNKRGETALHIAVSLEQLDVAALLLDRGANANLQDENGYTPLHIAVTMTEKARELLLKRGIQVNVNATDKGGRTPLHLAAAMDMTDSIPLLLERGAEVNWTDHFGLTPLDYARVRSKNQISVNLLLDRGAQSFQTEENM